VAQTRLKKRTRRPDVEACNDQPHNKLIEEVAEIAQSIKLLEDKLGEANDALQDLIRNKQRLERDIKVKKNTLLIDQQKCMSLRRSFPYNVVATRYY
jgi:tektin-3